MADPFSDEDRDACAREAATAIEAFLDQRCPEMKIAFWSAVGKLYRLDTPSGGPCPAPPGPTLDAGPPAPSE